MALRAEVRKHGYDFCQNPKNLTLGTFRPSYSSPSELILKNWDLPLFLLHDVKLQGKKQNIQRCCIADKWKKEQSQIDRALLLRWVSNHIDDIDFQLQYGGTFLYNFG